MNEPIRTDKEDRYLTEQKQAKPLLPQSATFLSKKKWIALVLVLLVLILLSFVFIRPSKQETPVIDHPQSTVDDQNTNNDHYDVLTPPAISRDATTSAKNNSTAKERIEIPGEVTDLLSQKIDQINAQESKQGDITLHSQNTVANSVFNELPLGKIIDNNHYTIQINASSSLESMLAFVKLHSLTNYQILEKKRNDKPWFILIKGNYPTRGDAEGGLHALSADLQNNTLWIKSGASINQ